MALTLIQPSGDETGAADETAAISALESYDVVVFGTGTFYFTSSIEVTSTDVTITGLGHATVMQSTIADGALFSVTGDSRRRVRIGNMAIDGGLYGVEVAGDAESYIESVWLDDLYLLNQTGASIRLSKCREVFIRGCISDDALYGVQCVNNCNRLAMSDSYIRSPSSHGVVMESLGHSLSIDRCSIISCGGNGVNIVATDSDQVGQRTSITNNVIEWNIGYGVRLCNALSNITGNTIEGNGDSGIFIDASSGVATAVNIQGNYFEDNATATIELKATSPGIIRGVLVDANHIDVTANTPAILCSGAARQVYRLEVGESNYYTDSGTSERFVLGDKVRRAVLNLQSLAGGETDLSNAEKQNFVGGYQRREMQTERVVVDCSAGGTAQETTLLTLPANTIIHEVIAKCTAAFNGTGDKTFEVGVSGSADKYIDTVDFDPSSLNDTQGMTWGGSNGQGTSEVLAAETALIATWTNADGTPSAGEVEVFVSFTLALVDV